MDPAEQHIEQGDQGEKPDQHDGDVQGEFAAVDGAAGNGADQVLFFVLLIFRNDDFAFGVGDFRFRHEHLGHEDGSGRGHNDRGKQVPRLDALRDVHGHDAARHMRHAAGHDGHQFAARGAGKKRTDGERASVWPMKMEAATFMLSAPEMRMVLSIIHANARMMICMRPM